MGIAGNERAVKAALGKYVYESLISYIDAYQYINTYVICGSANGTRLLTTGFMLQTLDRRTAVRLQISTNRRSCFIYIKVGA